MRRSPRCSAECLALDGLEVELAATGESGLERALARPPAVDLPRHLPPRRARRLAGAGAAQGQPADRAHPRDRVHGREGRSTAHTLGATEFLSKPFTGDQLREAVARQLSAERSSILVVDDDIALRRLVIETLARDGGELREAADGLEALAMISVRQPDVLVLDLKMPKLDGFGVLERLLERPGDAPAPRRGAHGPRADRRASGACCASARPPCSRSASTREISCAGSSARRSARRRRRSPPPPATAA